MSKLEELIKGLFPDGVDYYYLGDIGKFYGGLTGKSKDDFKDGIISIVIAVIAIVKGK